MISTEPEKLELGTAEKPRTYWLKRPVLHERNSWRRSITAAGGRFNGQIGLLNILSNGVNVLMEASEAPVREAVLGLIEAQKENVKAWSDAARSLPDDPTQEERENLMALGKACADGAEALTVVHREVMAGYPQYAAAVSDDGAYWEIVGIEAARFFIVKWEGLDVPLKRTRAGVADECLAEIPESDFPAIGMFADRLSKVTERERKNSSSPLASSSGGETSNKSNGATNGIAPSSESARRLVPRVN